MTKGSRLSKRKRNVLRRDDYFYFRQYIPFKYALLTKREVVNMTEYMAKFLFLFFLDLLKVLYFFLAGYATRLLRLLGRCATSLIEARFDCLLLRIYERSTCSKSSIVFTDTKLGPMKKRTTPIYATCTSSIMRLFSPKNFPLVLFSICLGTAVISRRNKKQPERLCKILGGQERCIMEDVQVTNPAILTEQAW